MKSVECCPAVVRLHLAALAHVRAREQCAYNIWADSQYGHILEQKTRVSENGNKTVSAASVVKTVEAQAASLNNSESSRARQVHSVITQ